MLVLELEDKRIPLSFSGRVELTPSGCWIWHGRHMPNGIPSYRRMSALNWLWDLVSEPTDVKPASALHRVPTICDQPMCLNLYHRLLETEPPKVAGPHRCPACRFWCGGSGDAAQ